MRSFVFSIALAVGATTVPAALAAAPDLVPRTLENGGTLELYASHERDSNGYAGTTRSWSDTFFKEKVLLWTRGYWYHPRFLVYRVGLGGGLKQESYESPAGRTNSPSGSSFEYDARLLFLPEHPYSLELFARRYEPLVREQSANRSDNLEENRGVAFRFRRRDYSFHARFTDDEYQADGASSDVTRLGLDAQYLHRFRNNNQVSFSLAYNPSDYSNTSGVDGSTDSAVLGNVIDLRRVRLNSSLSRATQEQDGSSFSAFESRQVLWYERLNVYLPWHFRSDLTYRWRDGERTVNDPRDPAPDTLDSSGRNLQFHLVHRLYESLDSTYAYVHDETTSSGGESATTTHQLVFNYTKSIPRGRILAGLDVGRSDTDNAGSTDVVDESHPGVAVPGTFRLDQANADAATIVVFLRSPLPPFEAVRLVEGLHYTVNAVAGTTEIDVFGLPPEYVIPGTYDFFVSYALIGGVFRMASDTLGWNASVELWDSLLTPYVSYMTIASDITEGEYLGVLPDSTTKTAGLLLRTRHWRAVAEAQSVEWDIDPYDGYRAELQYTGSLGPTSNVNVRGVYLDREYTDGTPYSPPERSDTSFSASGSVQKSFLSRRLVVSAVGGFSRYEGRVNATSYFLNGGLTYRVGRLDVTAGASVSTSDSEPSAGVSQDRDHQYYYLRLRRRFF